MKQGTGRESWDEVTWRAYDSPVTFLFSAIGHTQELYILGVISAEVLLGAIRILWASLGASYDNSK